MFNLGVVIVALYGDINKIKNYTISIQVLMLVKFQWKITSIRDVLIFH